MKNNTPPLLTRKDVSRLLQVSARTVERMEQAGNLHPIRLGTGRGVIRYHPNDIEDLIEAARTSHD